LPEIARIGQRLAEGDDRRDVHGRCALRRSVVARRREIRLDFRAANLAGNAMNANRLEEAAQLAARRIVKARD
jgi:hypothetical protein